MVYCMQVEVKKAEPRDVKLVADCHFDSTSLMTDTNHRPAASDVANADVDAAAVPASFTGTI